MKTYSKDKAMYSISEQAKRRAEDDRMKMKTNSLLDYLKEFCLKKF